MNKNFLIIYGGKGEESLETEKVGIKEFIQTLHSKIPLTDVYFLTYKESMFDILELINDSITEDANVFIVGFSFGGNQALLEYNATCVEALFLLDPVPEDSWWLPAIMNKTSLYVRDMAKNVINYYNNRAFFPSSRKIKNTSVTNKVLNKEFNIPHDQFFRNEKITSDIISRILEIINAKSS